MKLVDEVADLVNQLMALIDDSKEKDQFGGILRIAVDDRYQMVQMSSEYFVESFNPIYDVRVDPDYGEDSYILKIEVEGVEFFSIAYPKEVVELASSNTKHFEYITKQVQLETDE